MAMSETTTSVRAQFDEAQQRQQMIRAMVASAVGTSIEWYDFFLYGVAAALVFPQKYFPQSDPFVGTLLSFSTYFVGFAARPLGAAIFGHFGDRLGRKASLIATLAMMGVSTMAIGFIPDYATIGIWGAVLLTLGRVIQGIGVGGEWGGSVLLAGEWTDPKRRGFSTSWAQFGAPAGMVLANGAVALMTMWTTNDQFLQWGWRVPFLLSFVLIFIGLYIRLGIFETPVFSKLKEVGRVAKAPVLEVLRWNWREVILTALLRTSQQTSFYIFTTYVLLYATQQLGLPRATVLGFVMIQSLLSMSVIPFFGHLSDRFGRRAIISIGCVAMMIWPCIYFSLLDTKSITWVFVAILFALPIQDLQYGPQAAFISESFPGSRRYSGASLGYQLASITAGGPAPLVAVWLYQRYQTSTAIAVYLALTGVISLICVFLLKDRTGHLDSH
jgi:metabolite-proton symporter